MVTGSDVERLFEPRALVFCVRLVITADGSQLIVAVGVRVLVYDALDGDLLHSLKGQSSLVWRRERVPGSDDCGEQLPRRATDGCA